MSQQGLYNLMRAQAMLGMGGVGMTRVGTVSSYDPNAYAVKVLLQPEGKETGWLPLLSPWVGNGWGLFAPPSLGDMIEVHYQEGGHEAGFAAQRFFNDEDRPLACPSGEFWLVHKSGSALKFTNDGDVLVVSDRDLIATIGRNLVAEVAGNASLDITGEITSQAANWVHTGNMEVVGIQKVGALQSTGASGTSSIKDLATTGTLTSNGKNISDTHSHSGVTSGGSNTGGVT